MLKLNDADNIHNAPENYTESGEKGSTQKSADLLYIDRFDERDIQTAQLIYALEQRTAARLQSEQKFEKLLKYLGRNAFQALYKPTVALRQKNELLQPLHPLRDAMENAQISSQWTSLRESTVGNMPAASFAAAEFAAILVELLPETIAQDIQNSLSQEDQEDQNQEDNSKQPGSQQPDQSNQQNSNNQMSVAALTALLRQAAQKAADNTRDALELARAAGCEPGPDQPFQTDSLRLAQLALANEELKKFLKLLGRIRQSTRKTAPTIALARRPPHLTRRITRGGDITRIASHERILYQRNQQLFLYKAATEQLDIHDYAEAIKHNQSAADGPIIVMVDESASMIGEPIRWARALAAAVALDARRRSRPAAYIGWSSKDQQRVITLDQKGTKLIQILETLLQSFFQGGTELTPALEVAANLLRQKTFQQADIVLITDGDIHDLNQATSLMQSLIKKTRLHLIQIACDVAPLARFATSSVLLNRDQLDPSAAAKIIKNCFLPVEENRRPKPQRSIHSKERRS